MKITLRKIEDQKVEQIDYVKLKNTIEEAIVNTAKAQTEQHSVTREWMKFIIYPIFWGVAIISGLFALLCLFYGIKSIVSLVSITFNLATAITGVTFFFIGLIFVTVCIMSYFSAKEIDKEKDRQYVASMFSNIVALVALVVALVALFRG